MTNLSPTLIEVYSPIERVTIKSEDITFNDTEATEVMNPFAVSVTRNVTSYGIFTVKE